MMVAYLMMMDVIKTEGLAECLFGSFSSYRTHACPKAKVAMYCRNLTSQSLSSLMISIHWKY